jgi:hypothetical protein
MAILSKAHKVLDSAKSGIENLNCIQGKDVCLHSFVLCFLLWVQALYWADPIKASSPIKRLSINSDFRTNQTALSIKIEK